jgi:hypothetical protein
MTIPELCISSNSRSESAANTVNASAGRPRISPVRRPGLGPILAVVLGVGAFRSPASPTGQGPERLRYEAGQLDCARFRERSRSAIETYVAGQARRETVGLDGEWRFRAAPGPGDSIQVEAWLDTLSVWRRSEQDSLGPDTDGIIGGRYRGLLGADGGYRAEARPFVPDPLREVGDFSRALDDLLPRLPPRALGYGEAWSDGAGLEIRRLADSAGAGEPIHRFRLTVRRKADQARLRGDSIPLRVRQSIREDDTFAWHRREGLLRRERRISVETYVPTEARVRRPVQARIEQRVVLERVEGGC